MTSQYEHIKPHLLLIFGNGLVSASFIVSAWCAQMMDPVMITLIRFMLAAIVLAPFVLLKKSFQWPSFRDLFRYALISSCMVGFFWSLFEALHFTSSLNTGALFTLTPGISGVFGYLLFKEKMGIYRFIAFGLGIVGALWVIFRGDFDKMLALEFNIGDVIFFGGCLCMGLYFNLFKYFHRNENMFDMTLWILTTGVVWLTLISLPRIGSVSWQSFDLSFVAGILYLAIFATLCTFYINQKASIQLSPSRVMSYTYLNPSIILLMLWGMTGNLPEIKVVPGVILSALATFVLQKMPTPPPSPS